MGAIQVQVYNEQLMNIARYDDLKSLKNLYGNLENLLKLSAMGDTVAGAIFIDLENALLTDNIVTNKQRDYIVGYFLDGLTLQELGQVYGTSTTVAHKTINAGLTRIGKALINGKVFTCD